MRRESVFFAAVLPLLGIACSGDDDPSPSPAPPPAAAPSLALSAGAGAIPPANVGTAAQDLAVLRVVLSAGTAEDVRVDALVLRASGTADDSLDVSGGSLYADDGDGAFSAASDALVQGGMTFTADGGVMVFSPARIVPAGASETWWAVLDLAGSASVGETLRVSVPDATYVAATALPSSSPVPATGLPLDGSVFTVGHEWTLLATAGTAPPDLWGYSLVFDAANNRLVLFGGKDGAGALNNTVWTLNLAASPAAWSQLLTGGPGQRYGHAAAYRQFPQPSMVVFGGKGAAALSDTWSLSLSAGSESWSAPVVTGAMSPTVFACACWPAASADMILFGGCDQDPLAASGPVSWYGGIHKFRYTVTGGSWTYWGNGTYGAGGACMADDPSAGRVLVFGGWNSPGGNPQALASGFSFSWSTNSVSGLTFASPPAARWLSSWTVRGSDQRAYLFGGRDLSAALGDLRAYDLAAGTWSAPGPVVGGPPSARFGHSCVVLGSNPDRLYLFTGSPSGGSLWTFR
ncbi:MAG: hypothetical protein MUC63_00260 [Planctomycetes bacterium]|jgi:hypothetical protein|nr:hypothetical protein [Planctomycetota bacterium]